MNFIWRLMGFAIYGPWEDNLNRLEAAFYQKVAPHLIDTPFRFPKVFYAGIPNFDTEIQPLQKKRCFVSTFYWHTVISV